MKFQLNALTIKREIFIFIIISIIRYTYATWFESIIGTNFYLSFILNKVFIYLLLVIIRVILIQVWDKNYYFTNFFEKIKIQFTIKKFLTALIIIISKDIIVTYELSYLINHGSKPLSLTEIQLAGLSALSNNDTVRTINAIKWAAQEEGNEYLDLVREYKRTLVKNNSELAHYLQETRFNANRRYYEMATSLPNLVNNINIDNITCQNKLREFILNRTLFVARGVMNDNYWCKLPNLDETNPKSFDTMIASLRKFTYSLDQMSTSLNKHREVYDVLINKEATRLAIRREVLQHYYKNNNIRPQGQILTTLQNSRLDPILDKLVPR